MEDSGTYFWVLFLLPFALFFAFEAASALVRSYSLRAPKSEVLFEATVVKQFVPRISPYIKNGSRLIIVGTDGEYARNWSNGDKLRKNLIKWTKQGCEIHYILINAGLNGRGMLEKLAQENSLFSFHNFCLTCETSTELHALCKKYNSFHPTILDIDGAGNRAMWIEHDHQPGSDIAFGVEFLAPKEANVDARFDEYIKDFSAIMDAHECTETKNTSDEKEAA